VHPPVNIGAGPRLVKTDPGTSQLSVGANQEANDLGTAVVAELVGLGTPIVLSLDLVLWFRGSHARAKTNEAEEEAPDDCDILDGLVRAPTTPARLNRRVRAILFMADGLAGTTIAERTGYSVVQVSWLRALQSGLTRSYRKQSLRG
jgi:hypothetical protein